MAVIQEIPLSKPDCERMQSLLQQEKAPLKPLSNPAPAACWADETVNVRQKMEEGERTWHLGELYAQEEIQIQQQHRKQSRKMYSTHRLRDLYSQMRQREMEARRLDMEKVQRARAQFALDYNIQQRQNKQAVENSRKRSKCNLSKMALAQGLPESRADCKRNALRQSSKAKPKLNIAPLRKTPPSTKIKKQTQEEYFSKITAQEAELKNQERHKMIARAKFMDLQQDPMLQKRIAQEQKRQSDEEMRSRQEEYVRQEQEKPRLKQLSNQALSAHQAKQFKENQEIREKQMQQKRKGERNQQRGELNAKEGPRNQARKRELRKVFSKHKLEDVSNKKLQRGMKVSKQDLKEKQRLQCQIDLENKIQQKQNDQVEKFRNLQLLIENGTDKLETASCSLTAKVQKTEDVISCALAKQDALVAKQEKDEEEKRAAMIQSIAAHRERVIQERKQKEQAERKSNLDWLEAQKEADRQFRQDEALKAQRAREAAIECEKVNKILIAQQRAYAEKLKREECEAELRNAKRLAEREEELERYEGGTPTSGCKYRRVRYPSRM
ncbi:trichohyalin-like [Channa argus]|uniref:trichohyalin-like n=1 Tax=Channa argus TaxID=215402 RepID=UPI0035230171